MARSNKINTLWVFGTTEQLTAKLNKLLGKKYHVVNWATSNIPPLSLYEQDLPDAVLISPAALKFQLAQPGDSVRHLELMPKVMLLDENYTQADLELAIDSGIMEVVRPPYTASKILNKIRRAREIEAVQEDVLRMSKEIIMEREILERKNNILNFLVSFLTGTSISMNPKEILQSVFGKLNMIFPACNMQAALWDATDTSGYTTVYISAPENTQSYKSWVNTIGQSVSEARQGMAVSLDISEFELNGLNDKWAAATPAEGQLIKLPISMNGIQIGLLLVLTDMMRSLSRDQAMALNSALHHLALTINNAKSFQNMKQNADLDGLTKIFNRRHFDIRLEEEVERNQRYGQQLSLIFADIDHFKQINDTNGHRAGDAVLKQVSSIITNTLRTSDYAARYGGEEFVILLPHTSIKQALRMAERLRKNMAKHKFSTENGTLNLTISLGVADMEHLEIKDSRNLVQAADTALYDAKRSGRNCTMCGGTARAKVAV